MLTYELKGKNKYVTLYKLIRDDILSGKLAHGEKLPSKRALAENLSVSVVTVQTAYEQLLAEGYIRSAERSGYFVEKAALTSSKSEVVPASPAREEEKFAIDLVRGATPAHLFPFSVWTRLMRSVLADCGEHLLERVPCDGDVCLKKAVASYLYRARAMEVDPKYVVIGAGAEYLYGIIVRLLGRGKVIAVENPSYGRISSGYKLNGAECVFVSVNEGGICCDEVENSRANALHFSPSHQFPTGAVTPAASRARIISWAQSSGAYVIEDDYDSEFRLVGKPLQCAYSLCPERVIYMNTFSKSLAPSMRIGYMVLPHGLYEKYLGLFGDTACVVPLFEQRTLAKMLDLGHFERHIFRLKSYYRTVRDAIVNKSRELQNCILHDSGSGLHVVAEFPDAASDADIKARAKSMGINLKCVSDYARAPISGYEKCAVINYSGITARQVEKLVF